jgi:hypothetical protein
MFPRRCIDLSLRQAFGCAANSELSEGFVSLTFQCGHLLDLD